MAVSLKASADQLYRYADRYHHTADPFLYFYRELSELLRYGCGSSPAFPGSLASDAINGMITFPYLLFAPCLLISLIILSFNLFGDGLRDAFDPKLKN